MTLFVYGLLLVSSKTPQPKDTQNLFRNDKRKRLAFVLELNHSVFIRAKNFNMLQKYWDS